MKRKLQLLSLIGASLALVSCGQAVNGNQTGSNSPTTSTNGVITDTIKFNDLYSYSAISSISIMNSVSLVKAARNPLTDEEKQRIITNFEMVEGLINTNLVKSEESPSNIEGYEKMYTITITNVDGISDTYEYYYNEKITELENDEQESLLTGIVINNDVTYTIRGEKEIEDNEVEVSFLISLDDSTFVEIEQETEDEENGLEYTLYKDRREIYSTEIEYEIYNNKIKYSFEEEHNGVEREYEFIISTRDNETIVTAIIEELRDERRINFKVVTDENGVRNYIFEE